MYIPTSYLKNITDRTHGRHFPGTIILITTVHHITLFYLGNM